MPSFGCLTTTRRSTEKRRKLPKRRRKSTKLSIFSPGKTKTKLERLKLPERRN